MRKNRRKLSYRKKLNELKEIKQIKIESEQFIVKKLMIKEILEELK